MAIKKELLGDNPCYLYFQFAISDFSGIDVCYYCNNIIVSLLFKLCAKFSLRLQEMSKIGTCCLETDSVCLTEKFGINHQVIFLIWIFWQHAPYNYLSGVCSEFFYLSCRSTSKKFFSLYCSVFLSFCPCFSFHSFAILKLAFSLQNLLGRQEKQ